MEYEHETQVFNFIAGLMLGAAIGASVALLTAPQSGRRTRRRIRRVAGDIKGTAEDRWDVLAGDLKDKVDDAVSGARTRFTRS